MRRIQITPRTIRACGAAAALFLAVGVPAAASAATPALTPKLPSETCVVQASSGDNFEAGYCLRSGTRVAYQEHVICSDGKTYDGTIQISTNGSPVSKATCPGANNFAMGESITKT